MLVSFFLLGMQQMTTTLGSESIGKMLHRLAVPTILAQVINALSTLIDRIYIDHIPGSGALALSGIEVSFPIIMIMSIFITLGEK